MVGDVGSECPRDRSPPRCRLVEAMQKAHQGGWHFGAKLVKGAYLCKEQERSAALGVPCPLWDIQATHANYNRSAPPPCPPPHTHAVPPLVGFLRDCRCESGLAKRHAVNGHAELTTADWGESEPG